MRLKEDDLLGEPPGDRGDEVFCGDTGGYKQESDIQFEDWSSHELSKDQEKKWI